ncbi:PREDICTED: phospholipid scramblase 1-like [Priapulus caudatus]|uniref:Phospholipid scramblase n=1 Tax=Priapulus caudatus TaxID=37621 RepID=A0ABM1E969_PRICU|nr:PREDICTED: phospholipid scramblase 1-like [Priapulus caudatus]
MAQPTPWMAMPPMAGQVPNCPPGLEYLTQVDQVSSPPGTIIGYVEQEWSVFVPKFRIKNAAGDTILRISGPFCTFSCCGDVEFNVSSADGNHQVGRISKQWSGMLKETFTDSDNFGIQFPMDLDVNVKATLLGATFLIDFMFFEQQGNKKGGDRPGMWN